MRFMVWVFGISFTFIHRDRKYSFCKGIANYDSIITISYILVLVFFYILGFVLFLYFSFIISVISYFYYYIILRVHVPSSII